MKSNRAAQEPRWVRYTLLTIGLGFLFFFLALPLVAVFAEALAQGVPIYLEALKEPETRSAIWLTVVIALAVLPFKIVFGVAAAWAIAKFDFRGKSLLITLIDLPFAVSPVVAGLVFAGRPFHRTAIAVVGFVRFDAADDAAVINAETPQPDHIHEKDDDENNA